MLTNIQKTDQCEILSGSRGKSYQETIYNIDNNLSFNFRCCIQLNCYMIVIQKERFWKYKRISAKLNSS